MLEWLELGFCGPWDEEGAVLEWNCVWFCSFLFWFWFAWDGILNFCVRFLWFCFRFYCCCFRIEVM